MSKDIHHSCKCTGQNFTFEEWCKYLEQENRPEIVHQYKDFGFNIFDVCLTPLVKIDWANKTCSFEVVTAQSDNGRWDFGLISSEQSLEAVDKSVGLHIIGKSKVF